MENSEKKYDVFISCNSDDYVIANSVRDFLVAANLTVFFAPNELKNIGDSNYSKSIDEAIESSTHMIVLASKKDNLKSEWVQYEWNAFSNEIKNGRKKGNIISILKKGIAQSDLPISLRQYQSFDFSNYQSEILPYLNEKITDYTENYKTHKINRIFIIVSIIMGLLVSLITIGNVERNFIKEESTNQYNIEKKNKLISIDEKIKNLAGRIDSALSVVSRCEDCLYDYKFELIDELHPTIEYENGKNSKYHFVINIDENDINPLLFDYTESIKISLESFNKLDSLVAEYDNISSKQNINDCSLAIQYRKALMSSNKLKIEIVIMWVLSAIIIFVLSRIILRKV